MRFRNYLSKILGLAWPYAPPPSPIPSKTLIPPSSSNTSIGASSSLFCQLNQSPWDVYPNDQFFNTSFKGVESQQCSKEAKEDKHSEISEKKKCILGKKPVVEAAENKMPLLSKRIDAQSKNSKEEATVKENSKTILCRKTDGRKWFCKRPAQLPHPLCEHHLSLSRAHKRENVPSGSQDGRTTKKEKQKETENIYSDYYYYGEAAPSRGKRRCTRSVDGASNTMRVDEEMNRERNSVKYRSLNSDTQAND